MCQNWLLTLELRHASSNIIFNEVKVLINPAIIVKIHIGLYLHLVVVRHVQAHTHTTLVTVRESILHGETGRSPMYLGMSLLQLLRGVVFFHALLNCERHL